jgi:hypothetical protein
MTGAKAPIARIGSPRGHVPLRHLPPSERLRVCPACGRGGIKNEMRANLISECRNCGHRWEVPT